MLIHTPYVKVKRDLWVYIHIYYIHVILLHMNIISIHCSLFLYFINIIIISSLFLSVPLCSFPCLSLPLSASLSLPLSASLSLSFALVLLRSPPLLFSPRSLSPSYEDIRLLAPRNLADATWPSCAVLARTAAGWVPADLRHLAPGPEPCPEGGRAERPSSGPMGLGVSSDVSSGGLAERPGDRPGSALAMAFHEEQILQILHFLPPRDAMRIHLASKASVMSRCAVNDMLWTAQWAAQLPAALARSPDSSSQGKEHGSLREGRFRRYRPPGRCRRGLAHYRGVALESCGRLARKGSRSRARVGTACASAAARRVLGPER